MRKKLLSVILPLVLLLCSCSSPTGTSRADNNKKGDIPESTSVSAEDEVWSSLGGAYKATYVSTPDSTRTVLVNGTDIYSITLSIGVNQPSSSEIWKNNSEMIYVRNNGTINNVALCEDGLWVYEEGMEDGSYEKRLLLLDFSGKILSTIRPDYQIAEIRCSADGLYLRTPEEFIVINNKGELIKSYDLAFSKTRMVEGNDGNLYAVYYKEDGIEVGRFGEKNIEQLFVLVDPNVSIFNGYGDYLFLMSNDDGLYGLQADGTALPLLIWKDCGLLPMNIKRIYPLQDGEYLLWDASGVSKLIPVDPSEIVMKTELVLATVSNGIHMETYVVGFNRISSEYNVVIKDYTENGTLDTQAAVTRLNTDIISGKYPDLILFNELSPFSYINKGYVLDLYPLIDQDPDIDREDIAIHKQLAVNDKLFYLSNTFNIETVAALYSDFGDATGWTLDRYLEIEKNLPSNVETMYSVTRQGFLRQISSRYISTAVNWSTGKCDFNNEQFIAMLEASARVNENPEDPKNLDFTFGSVRLAKKTLVASATWVETVSKLAYEEKMAGISLSFIGWPTVDGSCGSDIHISSPIGICSQSNHPDAAWEFLKYRLTDVDIDSPSSLAVYTPYLQRQVDKAMQEPSYNGVQMTAEDAERFYSLVNGIDKVAVYDETILNIIEQEAAVFLAGDKTARETAAIIQSRVQIYVSEQQ